MKKRIIALLLLLILVLAACSSDPDLTKDGKDPDGFRPSRGAAGQNGDQPAPQDWEGSDVDIGMVDGKAYKNASLGISGAFSDTWYLNSESELAALNNLAAASFDRAAIADAIQSGQTVVIFCASELASVSSVKISAAKNPQPGADEPSLVTLFSPEVKAQYEQSGCTNVVCAAEEAVFCGKTHTVLSVTCDQACETTVFLSLDDLLYTVTVSSAQESMIAEALRMFESID